MGDIADEHRDSYFDWLAGRYDDDCFEDQANFDGDEEKFVRVWDGRKASPAEDFPNPPPEWPPAK